MLDFDRNTEQLYSVYKKTIDKIEANKAELERLEKTGQPKNTFDMQKSGFTPNINWIDAQRRHLHLTNEKTYESFDNTLNSYCDENKISKDGRQKLLIQFAERYENEKFKSLDQSQEYSLNILDSEKSQIAIIELTQFKGNSLEQSLDNAKTLLDIRKDQGKQPNNEEVTKEGTGDYNYNVELSFNKMEQNLENKVKEENELEQTADKDNDFDKE